MIFEIIRENTLQQWLTETKRERINETDDYSESFECSWQRCFEQPKNEDDHYSIFCSIGDWNTNLTDYLTDPRFDKFDLTKEEDKDIPFRQYTKILLTASEIMTDFQDTLSTFRSGRLLTIEELKTENKISRNELDKKSNPQDTQQLFTFINNVCKHKVNNIHKCNHHLHIHFADLGIPSSSNNTIRINNINQFISKTSQRIADTIEMPKLSHIINIIINAYKIVDETFKKDMTKFQTLCNLYKGESIR